MSQRLAASLLAVLLCASAARAEVLCGESCEPSALLIQGVRHFKPDAIRAALVMDLKYQELSAPQQPLTPCLGHLSAAIVSGYANAGMPVTATAELDKDGKHVLLRIAEGPLVRAGKVIVEGTKLFTAEEFQRKFAEPAPESRQPDGSRRWEASWVKGEPAPLDQLSLNEFALRAQEMFGALGRLEMDGSVFAKPGELPGTQDLCVVIRNEGTPLTIESVEANGAAAIPASEIVERSGLQVGQLLTPAALKAAHNALRETGQFSDAGLQLLPGDHPGMAKVVILVKERPWARPLSEKPSATLLTLQRTRQWLNHPEKWEEQLVLERAWSDGKGRIRVCWKPTAGLIAELDAPAGDSLKAPLRGTLALSRGEVAWFSSRTKTVGLCKAPGSLWAALDIYSAAGPEPSADVASINFFAGFTSDDYPPFYHAEMTPEAVYAWRNGWTLSPDGKLLSTEAATGRMTLDAGSGKFVSAVLGGNQVTLEKGAYDATLARARETVAAPPAGDISAPLALARDYLCAALQPKENPAPFRQALSSLAIHLNERIRPLMESAPDEPHPFRICTETARAPTEGATLLLLAASRLFSAHCTPWAILHDTAMVNAGKMDYRVSVERMRHDPRTGPFGLLMISAALKLVDAPLSASIARDGLQRCNWDAFDRELRALTEGDAPCARAIAAAVAAGADLTEQEWAGFATLGETPSQRSAIIAAGRSLRENRRAQAPETLSEALKLLWPETIRPALMQALGRLASVQPTPPAEK